MAKLRQFLLLIWKNFKLQMRHPWVTLFELGIPAVFAIVLVVIRNYVDSQYISTPTTYWPFSIKGGYTSIDTILYAPNNTAVTDIIHRTWKKLEVYPEPIGFQTEEELTQYYLNHSTYMQILLQHAASSNNFAGVVFKSEFTNSTDNIDKISYKIRLRAMTGKSKFSESGDWKTKYAFPVNKVLAPREKEDPYGGAPGYVMRGFLPLQHALDVSIMEYITGNQSLEDSFKLLMQRYPYPPYDDDLFLSNLNFFFPFVIMFSFLYPCLNIVRNLVAEKEHRLKHAMKMMGLSNWMHWTAWYLKYIVFLSISVAIITTILMVQFYNDIAVLNKSDPSVVFFVLLVYASSTICFCFFFSVFFSKANEAAAGAGILFFLSMVPYMFIAPRYADMSMTEKLGSCTLLNTALAVATIVLTSWESTGTGLQWSNLSITATPDDNLTMSSVLLMMIFDAFLYLVLAWYIEAVFPGEYGIPEPWYFPFTRSYWCGTQQVFQDLTKLYDTGENQWEFFEKEPADLMLGIQVQGLTKVYDKKKTPAVNNLYVNMYRGQITVLLGHNGAGKTTTISMLTGLFPPTSGVGIVNGYDICDDIEGVHSSLGICPQHNVLFDDLTVEEHLRFFCKLKGYIPDLVPIEVSRMISALGLEDKRKARAKSLSGGMKRKLSVGIALVGGSKIVMLDEPTSGMDPSARRFIWDLLQAEKEDRTILLTTHFMEEADILGDRIAIMARGEIQCCGSPLFLKKKYGTGYQLVMVKEPFCDVSVITSLVHSFVPAAEIAKDIGTELTYVLPHESSSQFQYLFAEIEKNKSELKISSFGASITTIEEVFIKVGERSSITEVMKLKSAKANSCASRSTDSGARDLDDEASLSPSESTASLPEIKPQIPKNTGAVLFCQQLRALITKRVLYSWRNRVLTLSQLFLPPLFLILTLVVLKTMPKPEDSPPLELNLQPFKGTTIPYTIKTRNQEVQQMASSFVKQFSPSDSTAEVPHGMNMTSYLLQQGENDIGKYSLHNIVAASFGYDPETKKARLKSWFNNQAFHSPAIALLYLDNSLLKYFTNSSYSISATNHPLPRTVLEQTSQLLLRPTEPYEIAQDMMFGMSFLLASFAVFLVKERSVRLKHLQRVSGVNLFSFWMATFLWDFVCYTLSCFLVLLVFLGFGTKGMSSGPEQGRLMLLFFIHGCSALPFTYCLSFLFQRPSSSYVTLCLCNVLGGIATLLAVTILELPGIDLASSAKVLDWLFTAILPNYCLGRSMYNLDLNYMIYNICFPIKPFCDWPTPIFPQCCPGKCGNNCLSWEENFLSWTNPGIGKQLVFLAIQFVAFFILLASLELKFSRYLKYKVKRQPSVIPVNPDPDIVPIEDIDVANERTRVMTTAPERLYIQNALVLKALTKYYGSLLAVDKLSFGVRRGECFGLLGLNGAGKTTTFKMITGEVSVSSGDVYLNGFSVRTSLRKVQQRLGYCPQFDALIDQLTGRETLTMFARLRGLPEELISDQVTDLSSLLCFTEHIDKKVKEYSGGNRRKLSVAIALIGDPPVIFLDEPTTGMDPVSRHNIWNALLQVLRAGQSIVLTSHSMEECEALCNKLAIMVNGKLCCFGSPQHLKSKYGKGFTLLVKVGTAYQEVQHNLPSMTTELQFLPNPHLICRHTNSNEAAELKNNVRNVISFIDSTFPAAVLKDVHEGYLHYHIPKSGLSWSQVFGTIEDAKESLHIKDYSVGQTSLEQVFLNFARSQRDQDE